VRKKPFPIGERNNSNNSRFLSRSNGGWKEAIKHFSTAERKELSTQNPRSSENILFKVGSKLPNIAHQKVWDTVIAMLTRK
jgi:hypothetical protein